MAVAVLRVLREGLPDRDDVFEIVYREHLSKVRGIVFHMVPAADFEDVVQETFLRVWKGLSFFRRHSRLRTWIYRIAVNTALDHLRLRSRRLTDALGDSSVEEVSQEQNPEDALAHRQRVQRLLASLDEDLRAVLALSVFEEFELQEIAKILEIPLGTVKSRLHRAREQSRVFLEKEGVKL